MRDTLAALAAAKQENDDDRLAASVMTERCSLDVEQYEARERLRDLMDGKQMLGLRGMARARFKVRELETKQRELDRLIAALDRRFSAMWSAGR